MTGARPSGCTSTSLPVKSVLGADEVTLFGAAAGDQRGDGDQTAIPRRKLGTLPDVADEDVIGERHERRGEVADDLLSASLGLPFRHGGSFRSGSLGRGGQGELRRVDQDFCVR